MSVAAKSFLCASIALQSAYAAVNRGMTVEVSAKGSLGTSCVLPAEGKEYTRTELETDHAACLKEIVEHEVGLHHGLLKKYEEEIVRIHGLGAQHFATHGHKHLVSLILGIQAAEAVIDAAEDLVADVETAASTSTAQQSEPSMPHTRESLQKKTKGDLDALIEKELEEHKKEIEDYTAELGEIDSKTAHFGSHKDQDLIAVILAQQAVEAIVETVEQLLEERVE